jgi:hypothetical protein
MLIAASIHLPRVLAASRKVWLQAATLMLALCALCLASVSAMAQNGKAAPSADETSLRTYTLRPETVDRALALVQDARRQKIQGNTGKDAKSLDDMAKHLSADPAAKALLDKHQISARDHLMTMMALVRARYAVESNAKTPDEAGTNAANVAYFKTHRDRINAAMRVAPEKADAQADAKPPVRK